MTSKDRMLIEQFGLLHQPLGKEHPYHQEPFERFPRHPEVGDPVRLGAITWPSGAAERVWTVLAIEGDQIETITEGNRVENADDSDHWCIELAAFDRRLRVTYRIYASSGDQVLHTDEYTFYAASWFSVGEVIETRSNGSGLLVECELQGSDKCVTLEFTFDDPNLLKIGTFISLDKHRSKASASKKPNGQEISFSQNGLDIHILPSPMTVSVMRSGKELLTEIAPMEFLLGEDNRVLKLRRTYHSPPDEAFYGFGERYNALNQRGEALDTHVFDQYTQQGKRTYYPVPFSLSSRGYALYLDTTRNISYDIAASKDDQWSYNAKLGPDKRLDFYLFLDPDPLHQIAQFADLIGKPEVPPRWVFGLWMSSNEWNSQEEVLRQARLTREHEIPATVLVIEAWSDEATFYIWNDARYTARPGGESFTYDDFIFPSKGLWPDPKGMIDSLHADGLRVILWQIPVLKSLDYPHAQHDLDREFMIEKGYAVLELTGEPYRIRPLWFNDGLVWDVTNPDSVEWWLSKRSYLLDDLGVDGFKTDGGEHLWGSALQFHDGLGEEMINRYPLLYVKTYHEFTKQHRGGEAITFSRAGFTGSGAFPAHWAGDETSTWEAFRASILAGLNLGMAGAPFWGWDIAGFSGEIPTAELYLRATAMAVFCPIMQYHSEFNPQCTPSRDRTPWNVQERTENKDVIPIFRKFANLRMNMLPMIIDQAKYSAETGIPMMRALPLIYPDDLRARKYPFQYLFGEDLLVAPVVEEGVMKWVVYLPEGKWFDLWTGLSYDGPEIIVVDAPIDRIPVFVRSGVILPLNLGLNYRLGEGVGNDVEQYQSLSFLIHAETDSSLIWYDDLTKEKYEYYVENIGETISVTLPIIPRDISLLIRTRCPERVVLDGIDLEEVLRFNAEFEVGWRYRRDENLAIVRLPSARTTRQVILHINKSEHSH